MKLSCRQTDTNYMACGLNVIQACISVSQNKSPDTLGRVFGGATAYPKSKGVWRDNERGGVLIRDESVVVHCYSTPDDVQDIAKLRKLYEFCSQMGRVARQGEVGLVIGEEYLAIRDFWEEP